ncbi:MAG: flagellar hook assembly protein FlgD [Alphaproteobacteria bacterium]
MNVNSAAQVTNTSATATSRNQIADKFDDFLLLLTTQLQHQDPLAPLDSTEFVTQLVSFTQVEQSINTNTHLESLISMIRSGQEAAAVGYLGKIVEAEGDTAKLQNGQALFSYDLPRAAASAIVTISDADGNVVFSGQAETTVGRHAYLWNGQSSSGVPMPDGLYTIAIKAKDAAGQSIPVATTFFGRVNAIDQSGDEVFLDVDSAVLPLDSILAVIDPAAVGGAP